VAGTRLAAWSSKAWSPEEIRTPGSGNRMVTYPYTKLMCANIYTDQAAALLLCSPEAARAAGVPTTGSSTSTPAPTAPTDSW